MNILELDCVSIDCENDSKAINIALSRFQDNSRIVQADDYWEVSCPSHDSNGKLLSFFAGDYVSALLKYSNCKRTVSGYTQTATGTPYAAGQLKHLVNKSAFTPTYTCLTIQLDNTIVKYSDGRLYIKKHKLQGFPGNRVSSIVDTLVDLVDCGVLIHNPRSATSATSAKHVRDSMQHVLCRKESKFTHHKFEWQATFDSELSLIVAPALQRSAVYTDDGMCYLWPEKFEARTTKGKRIQCSIKIYNISAVQEDRKGKPYQYIAGDIFKFEITFNHEFFIRHDEAKISDFKSQRDIFALLLKHISAQFKKFVLKPLTPLELKSFYRAAGAASESEFMQKLTNPDSLEVNLAAEIKAIKEKQAVFENRLAIVESYGVTLSENTQSIAEIKAVLGLHESNQDMRKLRLVA
jgi:hypothetical protein